MRFQFLFVSARSRKNDLDISKEMSEMSTSGSPSPSRRRPGRAAPPPAICHSSYRVVERTVRMHLAREQMRCQEEDDESRVEERRRGLHLLRTASERGLVAAHRLQREGAAGARGDKRRAARKYRLRKVWNALWDLVERLELPPQRTLAVLSGDPPALAAHRDTAVVWPAFRRYLLE